MLDKVTAPQMIDSRFVPVDEVMDLLGEPIVVGHIDDKVREHLDRLFVFNTFFDFLDSWGGIPKYHGDPQDCRFLLWQPHHHVLDFYFETAINTNGQGLIVFVGRELTVGIKNICRRDKI